MGPPPPPTSIGYERRRANLQLAPESVAQSSSFNTRNTQAYYSNNNKASERSPSPPASAYFPLLDSANVNSANRLRPTPDAQAHFAYSTTLRRHHVDTPATPAPLTIWARAVDFVTGRQQGEASLESARLQQEERRPPQPDKVADTVSARFAHYSVEETISHFRTSPVGLLHTDIPTLLATHGYNEFSVSTPESVFIKFAKTIYESPLILLLCGSATVSAVMGNVDDAVSIAVAVLIVLTVGFVQERRSEESLEALNKLVPHHCHVLRESQQLHLLANELVPGDVVQLSTGDRVPADIRLIEALELDVDESSLTGETEARRKDVKTCVYDNTHGEPVALADRTCIAYMGTLVRNGRGTGIVIATGKDTEFGVIFTMMQDVEEKRTPLQLSMDDLAQNLSILSFGIIGVICLIGVLQQRSWLEMFTIGVSLAVAAIPEGLPIVTTVTLALGVLRMAKRKAIVKKLHAVEALGSVSVICSDKTGTLTKNEMTVTEAYVIDESIQIDPATNVPSRPGLSSGLRKALEIGALCNNAVLVGEDGEAATGSTEGAYVGQSTDVALVNVLRIWELPDPRLMFKRVAEKPFSSEHKYMAVSGTHLIPSSTGNNSIPSSREMYYTKGSIEAILDRCKFYYVNDESTPALDSNTRNVILTNAQTTAARGLRVLAMAYGYGSATTSNPDGSPGHSRPGTPADNNNGGEKNNLVFAGFQAMLDPPRKGVADSIALLQSGNIQVVMITGDAEQTALSIARKLGLRVGGSSVGPGSSEANSRYCLTGKAIDQMSKAQLRERVGTVSVFARTTPRHKMAIVEAFQSRGQVVAMTGDGVNDAPALKMADIGVSMGKSGTDVAKEAADVILVDDNFSTILPAVEEGKSIFHNIQNFLAFQLSTAAAALTLITLSTMFGMSNPLNAMQILFINILMDGPPSQSLGVDPVDPAIMRRPPRKKNAPIITQPLLFRVLFSAFIIVAGTLSVYMFALEDDNMSRREQTMTFTCFVFLDLVSAIQNRGLGCGLIQNRMLILTVSVSFITQLALVYVPFMQSIFQTAALPLSDLGIIFGLAGISALLHEGRRTFERKRNAEEAFVSVMEEIA